MQDESSTAPLQALQERYILTQVGHKQLAFPAPWVAEFLMIERSQILRLPFYDPSVLGVVHHHGQVIPLVTIQQALHEPVRSLKEIVSVVQLSQKVAGLAGVGVVVDRILESRSIDQLPDTIGHAKTSSPAASQAQSIHLFQADLFRDQLWYPQRWQST